MATRKPLVQIAGTVQELPSGDSLEGGSERPVRVDADDPMQVYQAFGPSSALDAAPVFSVRRLTRTGMTSVAAWSPSNVAWSDRLTLVYS